MKKLIPALVFAAAISSPAFAEKGHNHDDGKEGAIGGMMMGMMSHDQMMAMHKHMQEMHDQMAKIKSETDPDKRHKLMQEHMEAMQRHADDEPWHGKRHEHGQTQERRYGGKNG